MVFSLSPWGEGWGEGSIPGGGDSVTTFENHSSVYAD